MSAPRKDAEYVVWACERTHSAKVNIEAWVRCNRHDWPEPQDIRVREFPR